MSPSIATCPDDKFAASMSTMELIPSLKVSRKPSPAMVVMSAIMSSSETVGLAKCRFSAIVPANRYGSGAT